MFNVKERWKLSFFKNENSVYAIRTFADDFIKSEFNSEITGDAELKSKVVIYLKKERIKLKLADDIVKEIMANNQTRLKYSLD